MLWCYDNAIAKDLENSFNTENVEAVKVKVMEPDKGLEVLAQAYNDTLPLPIVVLTRRTETPLDTARMNFTRAHKGVAAVVDTETNNIYYEKAIPVELTYDLTVLTSNTADRDELIREILFKYINMYFITFRLPYESKRRMRFGVAIDQNSGMSQKSGTTEYLEGGTIYQSVITLKCEGCMLVSYTPKHLVRSETVVDIQKENLT